MSIGPVTDALELCEGLLQTEKTWLPSVLHELASRRGIDQRKARAPRTWVRLSDFRRLSRDQAPACIVTSPGIEGQPTRDGDGNYAAVWRLACYVFVAGSNAQETADLVKLYAAAVRVAGVQHGVGVDGASKPLWRDEGYAVLAQEEARTVMAGVVLFAVPCRDVARDYAGPAEPPAAPSYPDADEPEVTSTVVTVEELQP